MNNTKIDQTTQVIDELKRIVLAMDPERRRKFIEWMKIQNLYLQWEQNFDPTRLRKYSRGEIIFANFGFNVGAEFGGLHYAVVVEDNNKSAGTVMVVPLSSLEEDESEEDVNPNEVYLGRIPGLNNKRAFAVVSKMGPISKLRIYKPKKAKEGVNCVIDKKFLLSQRIRCCIINRNRI